MHLVGVYTFTHKISHYNETILTCTYSQSFAGNHFGNCGWSVPDGAKDVLQNREYGICQTHQDTQCGLLPCQFSQLVLKPKVKMKAFKLIEPTQLGLHGVGENCVMLAFDVGGYNF